MKIRKGFVSNSSSSSFVVVGWEANDININIDSDDVDNLDGFYDELEKNECVFYDEADPKVIGYLLTESDEEEYFGDLKPGKMTFSEIKEKADKVSGFVAKKFGITGEPKLMWGYRNA